VARRLKYVSEPISNKRIHGSIERPRVTRVTPY